MDIQADILWIIKEVVKSDDPKTISRIKELLLSKSSIPEELGVSVEQYNKDIDEAEAQIEAGDFISLDELEQEMKEW